MLYWQKQTLKTPHNMKAKYIVGLGEVLWDILPSGRKLGGAPANFAYHVSQFGLPGCVVSAVGRDDLGLEIVEKLDLKNIESTIATVDRPTGTVEVTVDTAGIPSYDIRPDVAWDHIPFTPELEELARNTRAVAFGSLAQRSPESRDTIVKFISAMPDTPDTLIVFDINLRQNHYTKETVEQSLRLCNVLKINDEELETLKQMFGIKVEGPAASCRELINICGLKMVILTCGTEGSFVFSANGDESFISTPQVEVADTVGAGDSFTAAFIASLLRGFSVEDAHQRAVETAAYVCTQPGAMPPLPASLTR